MSEMIPKEWSTAVLGDLASIKGGKRLPKGETFAPTKTLYPYIRVSDFKQGTVATEDLRYVTEDIKEKIKRYTISSEDLYVSIAGTLGIVGEVPLLLEGALLTENAAKIVFDNKSISYKQYFKYFLNAQEAQDHFHQSKGTGGGVPKLALFRIEETPVLIPPLPEQKKIASILTSVDDVIEKTQAQIDKLKDLKIGMMQELLTKGIGHTEFKDSPVGRIPVGWDVKTLGDIANFINGNAFKSSEWSKSGLPIIRIQNLNGNTDFNYFCGDVKENWVIEPNTLLFAWSGQRGKSFGARIWEGKKGVLNQHIFKVTPLTKDIQNDFLYLILKQVQIDIERNAHGFKESFMHVKKSDIISQEIALPPIKEQQKISATIISINNKISLIERRLNQQKATKKALMQDLLTGKVRVNHLLSPEEQTVPEAEAAV